MLLICEAAAWYAKKGMTLGDAIDDLYWHSIDRPKVAHWLAAYELVRGTLTPHPASQWARGLSDEILAATLDAVET